MSLPRVSVLIPTYNRAELVCEAIDSVLQQTLRDLEIIVIDDGSTDRTEAALRAYGDEVRYFKQENAGMNPARNRALSLARGEFVALLDSDDLWAPYKLDLQVALLEQFTDVAFVFSNFYIFRGDRPRVGENTLGDGLGTWLDQVPERIEPYLQRWLYSSLGLTHPSGMPGSDFEVCLGDIYASSLVCPYVLPSTALIRKTAIPPNLQFPEIDSTGDWEFFARLSKCGSSLYVDLETTFNRSHEDAVRLTRVDAAIQVEGRVALIDRVWRADPAFQGRHAALLDSIQHTLLIRLARLQLLASRNAEARISLQRAAALSAVAGRQVRLLNVAARLPGSGFVLRTSRRLLHGVRDWIAGRGAAGP